MGRSATAKKKKIGLSPGGRTHLHTNNTENNTNNNRTTQITNNVEALTVMQILGFHYHKYQSYVPLDVTPCDFVDRC